MFKKTADHLASHHLQRHLLFLILAIITVWINGYHFGTFDQVAHISFLKKNISPELYPNDPFLEIRKVHYSFFWFFFIPLFRAGVLEESMLAIHILTVYGTFWMFWALSELLFNDSRTSLIIVLALIFPHLGFPGFQIIEFSLLNRTFALPFILGSIWLYLKNKRILAFLLLGLMFNIHAVYVVFVLCMFLFNEILTIKRSDWWEPVAGLVGFILFGLPVLIWRGQTGTGIDLSLRPELLSLAARSLLYTVYYPIGPFGFVIGNFLAGVGTLVAFVMGYHIAPSCHRHRTMKNFTFAIGILIFVAVVNSYILPITILLQFQILRVGVFLLYFGMLYLGFFLSSQEKNDKIGKVWFYILAFSFVITITPLVTIFFWLGYKALRRKRTRPGWLVPILISLQVVTISIGLRSGLWSPGFHVYGPGSEWQDIQIWSKLNTPVDAGFISPPHFFGHYTSDWRVFSERSPFATISEFLTIQLDPNYADDLIYRFERIAPGAIDSFNGNFMHSIAITKEKFYSNNAQYLTKIACQYGLDYLVVEEDYPYPFAEIYRNEGFILYQMPDCQAH